MTLLLMLLLILSSCISLVSFKHQNFLVSFRKRTRDMTHITYSNRRKCVTQGIELNSWLFISSVLAFHPPLIWGYSCFFPLHLRGTSRSDTEGAPVQRRTLTPHWPGCRIWSTGNENRLAVACTPALFCLAGLTSSKLSLMIKRSC